MKRSNGKPLGVRLLDQLFRETGGVPLPKAVQGLVAALDQARGGVELEDDITIAMLELNR